MILAIDTSSDVAGVALAGPDIVLGEIVWTGRASHSSLLTPSIERVLSANGVRVSSVDSIAVASGPGSFSGLRVGISAAKGLALALDIPLAGVGTLDIIAWQVSPLASSVVAVLPAGRGQVYGARYVGQGPEWERVTGPDIQTIESLAAELDGALLAGDAAGTVAAAAPESVSVPRIAPPAWNLRRPGFLAELGGLYFRSGGPDQRDRLEPLYLRRSAAEEKRAAAQE
jgi:tRNA threonylcarbamoyladenosine biosynthesis protein TsaB